MAVNKNFVVKNGLEVNTSLIFADAVTDKVGIANTTPSYTLHVSGGIGATDFYVSGISTFINGVIVSGETGFNVGSAGSVGIGTNTQNHPLEVVGTPGETAVQIVGDVNIDGTLTTDYLITTESLSSISTVTSALYVKDGSEGAIAEIDSINASGITSLANFIVTGVSTFSNVDDNILGITTIGSVQISGGVGIDKNLTVGSAATIGSSLFVGGKSNFYDYSIVNNVLNVNRIQTSTISFGSSLSVASQETEPREVVFSNDGNTMYVLGNTGNNITYYGLSTSWAVTSASYLGQYSVASQLTAPSGMYFKPDGTKFYVVGTTGVGAAATSVNQYTCSTPWDLTTASYDSVAFSVASQEASPMAIEFKPDGTKFYVVGLSADAIFQYSCATPWDLTTASYNAVAYSVLAQQPNPEGIRFSSDGLKLLVLGTVNDSISEYKLTTPWDISTISFAGIITSFSTIGEATVSGLYWKPDGSKIYVSGYGNDRIYEYNVTSNADLEVIGDTKLYGDTEMYQDVDVYGTLSAYNDVYLKTDLIVSGLTTTKNLYASGVVTSTTFNGQINAGFSTLGVATATNLTAQQLNVSGISTFAGITTVTGTTLFTKQFSVSGVSTFSGNIDANANLDVAGSTILTNTTVNGVLDVNGSAEIDNVRINDNEIDTISGNLVIDSSGGTTTLDDNISVSGTAIYTNTTDNTLGNVNTGSVQLDGGAGIAKNLSIGGSLDVTGHTELNNLNVSGVSTISGSLNLTTASLSAGIITATAFYGDGTNITGVSVVPSGLNGQIQYKDGSITGGTSNMFYDKNTGFVGIGSTTPTVALDIYTGQIRGVFKDYGETYYDLGNTGTSKNINLANGNFFTATLTGNCTFTFTTGLAAASSAVSFTLFLINDGTAGRSIIWPNTVWWPGTGQTAPTRTTTANRIDVYTFITYNNGAKWYGTISMFNYLNY